MKGRQQRNKEGEGERKRGKRERRKDGIKQGRTK
jgi:hypothetical protein